MGKKKNKKDMTFKEKVIDNINVFLSAYAIAFVIRLFAVEAYQIPSASMVPSLLVKDILMVEKVTTGSRLPLINMKMPGIVKPERNDIVVFVSPAWESPGIGKEVISLLSLSLINLDNTFENPKNLVKRLVGLPGDRISMTNEILTINGIEVTENFVRQAVAETSYNELAKMPERLFFDFYQEEYQGKKRIVQHIYEGNKLSKEAWQDVKDWINNYQKGLPVKSDFLSISPYKMVAVDDREAFYQTANYFNIKENSTNNNFPEIYVPKKGDVITFKDKNYYYRGLLKLLVKRESGKDVEEVNGSFYIDGKELVNWKVRDNYYFCMGDDRDLSLDCRYFGFIPEKNIFGKPLFRYWPFTRAGFGISESEESVKTHNFDD